MSSPSQCNPDDQHKHATAVPEKLIAVVVSNDEARAQRIRREIETTFDGNTSVVVESLKDGIEESHRRFYHLIIVDTQDASLDPLHELKRVRNQDATTPLLLIHLNTDAVVASRALRAGATAFLATREVPTLLETAMEKARQGERFVSDDVMQGILHGMSDNSETAKIPIELLSDREMMIFQLLGHGKCPRVIAEELGVNIKTIATHCNNIRRKLHTKDNLHLTRISHDWAAERSTDSSTETATLSQSNYP